MTRYLKITFIDGSTTYFCSDDFRTTSSFEKLIETHRVWSAVLKVEIIIKGLQ